MNYYECQYCGEEFSEDELDQDLLSDNEYFCKSCAKSLISSAHDAVDPLHIFESIEDWDEHGR